MGELPKKVQDRLNELSREFVDMIPERLREMRSLMDQADSGTRESLRELRLRVHRITGSAATFGYEVLSETARDLELTIERNLTAEVRKPSQEAREAFALLTRQMEELQRSGPEGNTQKEGTQVGIPTRHDRVVVLLGDVPGLPDDFGEQVSVFRFALSFAEDIAAIPEFCELHLREEEETEDDHGDDLYRYVVLVTTVDHFAGKPGRLKTLQALRELYRNRIVLIFLGDEDDFQTRLCSVRFGADAFLSTPVDVTRFFDGIDKFTEGADRQPYHVLIVDDDPEQVSDTALVLQEAGMITSVVTDPTKIFQVLVEYRPELILLDMYMPECSGAELARIIRQNENYVGVPILYLSMERDEEKQLAAIRSGGDGFLVKPMDPEHLVTTVSMRAARTRAMRFFMERDSLTGLLNHTNLKQHLDQEMQRARRIGLSMVFCMIDLDRFKSVNDTYGHLTGDRVIKSLARLLQERLRRSDTIGRYGGEEFGVILFNTDASFAETIMNEIRESFSRIRQTDGHEEFFVTLSCGVAEFPRYDSASAINEAADGALYKAKESGRNRVVVAGRDAPG
ncbi:MAG: diguanylate cyclase [Spirochaetaceae bacterium]|nr:MAG: diguanylate cyclase [Spirochaetaceae bacterium]